MPSFIIDARNVLRAAGALTDHAALRLAEICRLDPEAIPDPMTSIEELLRIPVNRIREKSRPKIEHSHVTRSRGQIKSR